MPIPYETPLHFALIWIATRDQALMHMLLRDANKGIKRVMADAGHLDALPSMTSPEQLQTLFAPLAEKSFGVRGTSFEKGPHINRVGLFDTPYDKEIEVNHCGHNGRIGAEMAFALDVEIKDLEFQLWPKNWLFEGGILWRDIEVYWPEVLGAFPASGTPPLIKALERLSLESPVHLTENVSLSDSSFIDLVALASAWNSTPTTHKAVLKAFLDLCNERIYPYADNGVRDNDIRKRLGGIKSSTSTIFRVFTAFNRRSGLDLNENEHARRALNEHLAK